jgi:hypothetical protein
MDDDKHEFNRSAATFGIPWAEYNIRHKIYVVVNTNVVIEAPSSSGRRHSSKKPGYY